MSTHLLRLFIAGSTPRSRQAITSLQEMCEKDLAGQFSCEVIDVLERPDLAEQEKVVATPTLEKKLPLPVRRVIGDLSNKEEVFLGLDLATPAQILEGEEAND